MKLTEDVIKQAITEIEGQSEKTRRELAKRRLDIYKDGGKQFLIDQITREFSKEAVQEMRLAPINLLKKIVNKRSSIYKRAPIRKTDKPSDQKLIDYYVEKLRINQLMQKANRYFNLLSNEVIYVRPCAYEDGKQRLHASVVPNTDYSKLPNPLDQSLTDVIAFSAFLEGAGLTPEKDLDGPTGQGGFTKNPGSKAQGDKVASNETETDMSRQYLFWSDEQQATTAASGQVLDFKDSAGKVIPREEQMVNPIGRLPVVEICKDRDNEAWAQQGEDIVDLTIAIQLGWTDVLTIAKHQGYSLLTISSEEEPKQLTLGINKSLWLKLKKDGPTPSVDYASASSPLAEYGNLLGELLSLLLTTNDMEPGSIAGKAAAQNFTSGFHALIAKADTLEAIESDKPTFQDAEVDLWDLIALWHNKMFDTQVLEEDAKKLGKFSDGMKMTVQYADAKPLESEQDRLNRIKEKIGLKLQTRKQALKELNPELDDKGAEALLLEIDGTPATPAAAAPATEPKPGSAPTPAAGAPKPDTAATPAAGATTDIQKQAFNGAQVSSLVEIVTAVAGGTLPRDSAIQMVSVSFQLSIEEADKLIGSAGKGFVPTKPTPAAPFGGAAPAKPAAPDPDAMPNPIGGDEP